MSGRTIAIGDIHGCYLALEAVLNELVVHNTDTIVTLGDYVDRGPESNRVIERLLQLQNQCHLVSLMGNHEVMLLSALQDPRDLEFWMHCGGAETLESYGGVVESIPESHIEFIEQCALAYESDQHVFVHANYQPDCPIDEQDEQTLLWTHLGFEAPRRHVSGKTVVVGHTPQLSGEVLDRGHLICIDTFCFGDGWLTALDVQSKQVWQADKQGTVRTDSPD